MSTEPVRITVALAAVLSTGVALVAVFLPGLDQATQGLIIAFGNALIGLGAAVFLRDRVTPA